MNATLDSHTAAVTRAPFDPTLMLVPTLPCLVGEDVRRARIIHRVVCLIPVGVLGAAVFLVSADDQRTAVAAERHGAAELVPRVGVRTLDVGALRPLGPLPRVEVDRARLFRLLAAFAPGRQ